MNQRGAGGVSAAGGATRRAGSSAQPSALRQRFFGGLFGGSSRSPSPMAAQFRGGGDLQSISATQASAAAHGAPSSRVAAAAGGGGGQQDADTGRGASTAVATLVRQHNGGSGEDGGNEGGSAGVEAGAGQDRWSTIQEPMRFDIDLGYRRDIRAEYDVDGDQIGKGGNGKVVVVTHRESGKQFACKIIPKVLDSKRHTERKCRNHLASLQREISVLQALRGSLSVVELHNVFEDEDHVWIVMEWCKGGELRARISERFYSERTVASFLRGVLRTVAVMHNHHILHRDIKPGNFMLLNDSDRSPLKAIDFGLATPFDPDGLPISTLGLEGTPWYMAPEVLNHSVTPASDLWSIGVMAAELLTGKMPFDDHKNPRNARLSAIWGSILSDELDMRGHAWNGISDDAKMFVASLLQRDPSKRPTAKEALRHPWLKGDVSDRSQGRQLQRSVVQRIQRFGQGGVLQRAVLQGIVQDLLTVPAAGGSPCSVDGDGAACRGRVCDPTSALLEPLYAAVGLQNQSIGIADLADRLKTMGFKLEASEMARLLEQLDVGSTGSIGRAAFAASQLDWKALQNNDPEEWARVAGDAFRQLDEDDDGILSTEDIATAMARRMPADEARAVAQSLLDECKRARVLQAKHDAGDGMELASMDASGADWQGMDLRDFITMLRVSSCDTLDIYEDGLGFDPSKRDSVDVLNEILQHSGGEQPPSPVGQMELAPEGFFRFDHSKPRKPSASQETAPKLAPPGFFRFDVKEGGGAEEAAERQPSQKTMFRFDVVGRRRPREPEPAPSQRALAHEPRVHAGGHFDKRHRGSNLYLNEITRLMTVNK